MGEGHIRLQRPVEMGGGIFVVVALTPYGGWHKEAKEWTDRVAHTGDKVPHDARDERFDHPSKPRFFYLFK